MKQGSVVSPLPVVHVLGPVIAVLGGTMLVPLAIGHFGDDAAQRAYDLAVLFTVACGVGLWAATRRYNTELHAPQGFLLVALVWTLLPAFACLPLLLALPGLSFTDAYFETASGMTTTGATVLTGLDALPPSINVWRAMLQWLGGMGVVVLVVAVLPLLGVGGRQLFKAETPGPMKDTKLTARMRETAKGLWTVYCLMTAACIAGYWLAGMTPIDALIHAFSTMSLGGYSSHDASYGYFDSPAIELVAVVFMLAAGINFSTHFSAMFGRSVRAYRRDPELLWFVLVLLASCALIATFLWLRGSYPDFTTAARFAVFNVVSIATTTGYASTDYNAWPIFAPLWMLALCCFASCSGSTGGGIKMIRFQVMLLNTLRMLKIVIHPRAFVQVRLRELVVPNEIVAGILVFFVVFSVTTIAATLLLAATGLDFLSASTAAVACITNTGPGLGVVGPAGNYASLSDLQKWVCTAAMLLGRLELFTLLVVFTPRFWRA
jgi:trk system potassium uptake protein TrkH